MVTWRTTRNVWVEEGRCVSWEYEEVHNKVHTLTHWKVNFRSISFIVCVNNNFYDLEETNIDSLEGEDIGCNT